MYRIYSKSSLFYLKFDFWKIWYHHLLTKFFVPNVFLWNEFFSIMSFESSKLSRNRTCCFWILEFLQQHLLVEYVCRSVLRFNDLNFFMYIKDLYIYNFSIDHVFIFLQSIFCKKFCKLLFLNFLLFSCVSWASGLCLSSRKCSDVFINDETFDMNRNAEIWPIFAIIAGHGLTWQCDEWVARVFVALHNIVVLVFDTISWVSSTRYLRLFGFACEGGTSITYITQTWLGYV